MSPQAKTSIALVLVNAATACSSNPDPRPSVMASQVVRASPDAIPASARPVRAAVLTNGECGLNETSVSGMRALSATFPSRQAPDTSIAIELDSRGTLLRYRETRGIPQPSRTIEAIQQELATMTRTQIQLDFATGEGLMLDFEPGQQPRSSTRPNSQFQQAETRENFEERIGLVQRLCSAQP